MTKVTYSGVGILVLNHVSASSQANRGQGQLAPTHQGELMNRSIAALLMTGAIYAMAMPAMAADAPAALAESKPAVAKPATPAATANHKVTGKVATPATNSISSKNGDNQYPGVAVVPPKPPKKEALDAAALKAQGAVAK
jgi:hypothetical protein